MWEAAARLTESGSGSASSFEALGKLLRVLCLIWKMGMMMMEFGP